MPNLSATMSVDHSTVSQEQIVTASVTVSNAGTGAIGLLQVVPTVIFTGDNVIEDKSSVSFGVVDLSPGSVVQVPASGSLLLKFGSVFHAPSGAGTYTLSCNIFAADGEVLSPAAPVLITVVKI